MYEIWEWLWEHRNVPITWATIFSFMWLVIDKLGRRLITDQLKRLFRVGDKSEFSTYVRNQNRIEQKIDLLLADRGIKWDAVNKPLSASGENSKEISSLVFGWETPLFAIPARQRIMAIHSELKACGIKRFFGRNIRMNKLASRKLWVAVITAVCVTLNQQLGLGLDDTTVVSAVGVAIAYILGQAHVDAKNAQSNNSVFDADKSH